MDFPTENEIDTILAEIDKEISVGDLMGELGCSVTADAQQCKEILSSFAPLTEATISKILGNVTRTCTDLEDNNTTFSAFSLVLGCCFPTEISTPRSWSVDILIETIKQLVSYPCYCLINILDNEASTLFVNCYLVHALKFFC